MLHRTAIAASVLLSLNLFAGASPGNSQVIAQVHPEPWPIWDWHKHQPTQKDFDALQRRDLTPAETEEVNRLYMQQSPDEQIDKDMRIMAPEPGTPRSR